MDEGKRIILIADDGNGTYEKIRKGARAVLCRDGKLLLGHELATGYYGIPGGGWEEGETLEETCKREMVEEMGILVDVVKKLAVVESRWEDMRFENHFFLCTERGETETHQTAEETRDKLTRAWVTMEEARAIFTDPMVQKQNVHWIGCCKRDEVIMDLLMKERNI